MPQSTIRYGIDFPTGIRILFSIVEKSNGELILPIKSAERMGPDWTTGPIVLEQRYSIHPSPKSADFTTIKQTINLEGGKSITTVALTDAVKKKSGFSIILVRRCQNLVDSPQPAFRTKPHDRLLTLNGFDPITFTLFFGLFVGHPETKFDTTDDELVIAPFYFQKFQVVLITSLFYMPSYRTTEMLHALTSRPESAKHQHQETVFRHLMMGKSPEICVRQYRTSVRWLAKNFLEKTMLPQLTTPSTIDFVREQIARLGDVTLSTQELGTTGQLIHMLSDGKPPIPR
jgi:hypothetical protein